MPDAKDGSVIYFRVPDYLKRRIEFLAAVDNQSVNTWLMRQVEGISRAYHEYHGGNSRTVKKKCTT